MLTASTTIEQGFALHRAGQLGAAEQVYRQVLAADPKNAEAWHLLGAIAHQVGKEAYAVECITRAIGLSPNVSSYHNNIGEAHRNLGQLDQAIASYRRALELNPDYPEAHQNLGDVLQQLGKSEEAVPCHQRAAEAREKKQREQALPDYSEGLHRAFHERSSGQPQVAIAPAMGDFEQKIEQALKDFPKIDKDAAGAACRAALCANAQHVKAHVLLGMLDALAGRFSMAETALRTALQFDPACAAATRALAELENMRRESLANPYMRHFFQNRAVHMDYPRNILIETLGHCNAKCGFCPQGKLERRTTKMTDALFEKILGDLRQIPPEQPVNIFPGGVTEPLLDPHLIDRLAAISQAVPQATIGIFTNFSIVPESFFDGIASIRNLMMINVSLNAANPEEYRAVMDLDLDKTVRNIKRFMTENRKHRALKSPVLLSRVGDLTDRDEKYFAETHALFPEFEFRREYSVQVKHRMNWLGNTDDQQSPIPYSMPCGAWLDFNIFCNGTVPLCCADANGKHSIGDVNKSSILEIYNSRPFRNLRERLTSRETVHPCNTCALWQ